MSVRIQATGFATAAAAALFIAGCAMKSTPGSGETAATGNAAITDPVKRGEYLVTTGACGDCHTPWIMTAQGPAPDPARLLSGHPAVPETPAPPALDPSAPWNWMGSATFTAFAGPWGVSYSANLTPHESGLGVWTEEMFIAAMRTGKHMGAARPILPPMPWPAYGKMTDEDLRAIFAYLMTIPPVENAPPAAVIAAPPSS